MKSSDSFERQLDECRCILKSTTDLIERGTPCDRINYRDLYENLYKLFPETLDIYRDRLRDVLLPNLKIHDYEGLNRYGQRIIIAPNNGINPFVLGQVIATLNYISESLRINVKYDLWTDIHPMIAMATRKLFEDSHYAEAVEVAFLEITVRVKRIIKVATGEDLDGTAAMQKAFSVNNPIIRLGNTTKTGKDIQQGIMELFTGAIRCIRNPKAHEKIIIDKTEAIRKLYFASFLMSEIDKTRIDI